MDPLNRAIENISTCLETAAALTAVHEMAYEKGFNDAVLLKDFCVPVAKIIYFPLMDIRPRKHRSKWTSL
jgi:hypothetical protein